MSSVTYRYEQNYSFLKKGVKHTVREQVIDGSKGLSVMLLEKKGDDFYKMYAMEIEKDKFEVEEKKGEAEEPKKIISEKDLLKVLKDKKLDTIVNYITKERGTYKGKKITRKALKIKGYDLVAGGAKKSSKKASNKSSKKASKKSAKKN
tara:strand:- start:756 stop:1202 length:447 start_codon:yes stop_codon:yes gene_type:complete